MVSVINNNNNNKNNVKIPTVMKAKLTLKTTATTFLTKTLMIQSKQSPQTTINAKVVQAMKKLQASYNNDANKNCQTSYKKRAIKNLNLYMVTSDTKSVLEECKTFNEMRINPMQILSQSDRKLFASSLLI